MTCWGHIAVVWCLGCSSGVGHGAVGKCGAAKAGPHRAVLAVSAPCSPGSDVSVREESDTDPNQSDEAEAETSPTKSPTTPMSIKCKNSSGETWARCLWQAAGCCGDGGTRLGCGCG